MVFDYWGCQLSCQPFVTLPAEFLIENVNYTQHSLYISGFILYNILSLIFRVFEVPLLSF